jgi:hypothetical protein
VVWCGGDTGSGSHIVIPTLIASFPLLLFLHTAVVV